MKTFKKISLMIFLFAVFGFLVFFFTFQHNLIKWNQWVNLVQIVGQKGSTEQTALELLGEPLSINNDITKPPKSGQIPLHTEKVYEYMGYYPAAGVVWFTYIFIDKSGNVVGVHITKS